MKYILVLSGRYEGYKGVIAKDNSKSIATSNGTGKCYGYIYKDADCVELTESPNTLDYSVIIPWKLSKKWRWYRECIANE